MVTIFEKYRSKLLRAFEPPLSKSEIDVRLRMSFEVASYLMSYNEYAGWIVGVWLFGSLARGTSKPSSDIDLAVWTLSVVEFGDKYIELHERMYNVIQLGKKELGIPESLLIFPAILQDSWRIDPEWTTDNPALIYRIENEGKILISK